MMWLKGCQNISLFEGVVGDWGLNSSRIVSKTIAPSSVLSP